MNNNKHTSAFPTFPIQDKFGNTVMNFGMSKIEIITTEIMKEVIKQRGIPTLSSTNPKFDVDKQTNEMIAEAYKIADKIISYCEEQADQDTKQPTSNIIK